MNPSPESIRALHYVHNAPPILDTNCHIIERSLQVQTVMFTGYAQSMFWTDHIEGTVAGVSSDCPETFSVKSYDHASGIAYMHVRHTPFTPIPVPSILLATTGVIMHHLMVSPRLNKLHRCPYSDQHGRISSKPVV